jgi:hypothetical protein
VSFWRARSTSRWLVRIYAKEANEPKDLLDADPFGDAESIRHHLLSAFVPAIYEGSDQDEAATRHRLEQLASHMQRRDTEEFAWWDIRNGMPWPARAVIGGLLIGLLAAVLYTLAIVIYVCIDLHVPPTQPVLAFALTAESVWPFERH